MSNDMTGNVWAVLPVRSFAQGKQRLAGVLDEPAREALCRALLADALAALKASTGLAGIVVVSADPEVLDIARSEGVCALEESAKGLNAAVMQGALWVSQEHRAGTVLVMHADLPLVHAAAIEDVLGYHQALPGKHCTLVPDRHGQGTNLLLVTPPCAMPFAFGEGSLDQHLMGAVRQGLRCSVLSRADLGCDLDTAEDLYFIREYKAGQLSGQALGLLRVS